jgi:GNAT superfamily N-acetyltransferase
MKREEDEILRTSFWSDPLNWLWHKPQEWRHRLRFWHNPAPGPEFEPVQDARGRTYWLRQSQSEIGEIGVWRLFYRGDQVGEANGLRFAGEANFDVGNLEIDPAHQGRSLGAVLLSRVEAEARRQGASLVTGRIVAKDAAAFPGLMAWYQAQGDDVQVVEAKPSRGGTHDVAQIRKGVERTC